VKLLIQPGDGIEPLVRRIKRAKKSIEIVIFRFDRTELERALEDAAKRGVFVHALIAYTNRGGEKNLRKLEMRLLAGGVTVARTSDELVRYHGKMMIVDRKELHLLAFNFTFLDIEHSRSFGVITRNRQLVQEAVKLFERDTKRQPYTPGYSKFLVSPLNARKQLASFIKGAKKELLIYDIKISDRSMIRLLEDQTKAGVEIRIIGKLTHKSSRLTVRKLTRIRLHSRTIVRDRKEVFMGSQSLRELELDARREIGVIFRDSKVANSLVKVFEEDWNAANAPKPETSKEQTTPAVTRTAKKVAKTVTKDLHPVAPVLKAAVKDVMPPDTNLDVDYKEVEENVKDAVKEAVQEVVKGAVEDVVEHKEPGEKR